MQQHDHSAQSLELQGPLPWVRGVGPPVHTSLAQRNMFRDHRGLEAITKGSPGMRTYTSLCRGCPGWPLPHAEAAWEPDVGGRRCWWITRLWHLLTAPPHEPCRSHWSNGVTIVSTLFGCSQGHSSPMCSTALAGCLAGS